MEIMKEPRSFKFKTTNNSVVMNQDYPVYYQVHYDNNNEDFCIMFIEPVGLYTPVEKKKNPFEYYTYRAQLAYDQCSFKEVKSTTLISLMTSKDKVKRTLFLNIINNI